jgi:hypothetical protein
MAAAAAAGGRIGLVFGGLLGGRMLGSGMHP